MSSHLRFPPCNTPPSSSFPDMARFCPPPICLPSSSPSPSPLHDTYREDLWQACAGPLVSVPKIGQRVWYFPQGHLEQVAASTGQTLGTDQQMPQYNLPSQILCRVMNLTLNAEPETDEVFAQLALLPESEDGLDPMEKAEEPPAPPQKSVRMFTKILTASDTSTHGGFSVLRKHADECLPPLDTSQDTPSQELVATDLHGQVWKFRHTYRGHPRRHLLTTGWSYFVSQKKLVAGDAVIFLRGENGELRVGIRRTKRQQPAQTSNVLTSDSMHMGVVATASHSIVTRTMFAVYYKPRASPSSFIVPVEKLAKVTMSDMSVGMRFKMKFEGDDASERSYSGTITGIEDLNAVSWPKSKWRTLKVNWDEMTNHEQRDRVSPWEIELCVHQQAAVVPSNIGSKNKKSRIDTGHGNRPVPFSPLQPSISKQGSASVQGQDLIASGAAVVHGFDDGLLKSRLQMCSKRPEEQGGFRTGENMKMPPPGPPHSRWLMAGKVDPRSQQHIIQTDHFLRRQEGVAEDVLSFFSPRGENSMMSPRDCLVSPMPSAIQMHSATDAGNQKALPGSLQAPASSAMHNDAPSAWPFIGILPSGPSSAFVSSMTKARVDNSQLSLQQPPSFSAWGSQQKQEKADAENGCKLFGISLTEPPKLNKGTSSEDNHVTKVNQQSLQATSHIHHDGEGPEQSDVPEKSNSVELEHSDDTCVKVSKESEGRGYPNPPSRSCTKVIKKGSMVGRGVDLSKFDGYAKLIEELEIMFHIEGELSEPEKGWQIAYSDDEGDMMQVGDDPWTEFCSMVRKIHIFSPEEVHAGGLSQSRTQGSKREQGFSRDCRDSSVPALPG